MNIFKDHKPKKRPLICRPKKNWLAYRVAARLVVIPVSTPKPGRKPQSKKTQRSQLTADYYKDSTLTGSLLSYFFRANQYEDSKGQERTKTFLLYY